MRAPPWFAAIPLLVACGSPPALAQAPGSARDMQATLERLDCSMLARMPNPPMSMEACEARKRSYGNLSQAVDTSGGERPGDEAMTCTEIIAEMQASRFAGVGADTAAEGVAAGTELQAAYEGGVAAAGALAAKQGVETAAAAMLPNAVQGTVAYRHAAEQQALAARTTAAVGPARDRAMQANAASSDELAASLRANPRFARLMQLVQARNCQFEDAPVP